MVTNLEAFYAGSGARSPGAYRRNPNGEGWVCLVCGSIHDTRGEATICCKAKKLRGDIPGHEALNQAEQHLHRSQQEPRQQPRLEKDPGEGTAYRDRWGHWRRGKLQPRPGELSLKQLETEYHRAQEAIKKERERNRSIQLNQVYGPALDSALDTPKPKSVPPSPGQKAAFSNIGGHPIHQAREISQARDGNKAQTVQPKLTQRQALAVINDLFLCHYLPLWPSKSTTTRQEEYSQRFRWPSIQRQALDQAHDDYRDLPLPRLIERYAGIFWASLLITAGFRDALIGAAHETN